LERLVPIRVSRVPRGRLALLEAIHPSVTLVACIGLHGVTSQKMLLLIDTTGKNLKSKRKFTINSSGIVEDTKTNSVALVRKRTIPTE
jgi:hypothetical protein